MCYKTGTHAWDIPKVGIPRQCLVNDAVYNTIRTPLNLIRYDYDRFRLNIHNTLPRSGRTLFDP